MHLDRGGGERCSLFRPADEHRRTSSLHHGALALAARMDWLEAMLARARLQSARQLGEALQES